MLTQTDRELARPQTLPAAVLTWGADAPVHVVAADEGPAPSEGAGVVPQRLGHQVGDDEQRVHQVPQTAEPVGQLHTEGRETSIILRNKCTNSSQKDQGKGTPLRKYHADA